MCSHMANFLVSHKRQWITTPEAPIIVVSIIDMPHFNQKTRNTAPELWSLLQLLKSSKWTWPTIFFFPHIGVPSAHNCLSQQLKCSKRLISPKWVGHLKAVAHLLITWCLHCKSLAHTKGSQTSLAYNKVFVCQKYNAKIAKMNLEFTIYIPHNIVKKVCPRLQCIPVLVQQS